MHYSTIIVSLLASSVASATINRCEPSRETHDTIEVPFTLNVVPTGINSYLPWGLAVVPEEQSQGGEGQAIIEEQEREVLHLRDGILRGSQGRIAGLPRDMDHSLRPKKMIFTSDPEEQQIVYFEAVQICDSEGNLQEVLRVQRHAHGLFVDEPISPGKNIKLTVWEGPHQNIDLVVERLLQRTTEKKMKNVQVAVQVEI